MSENAFRRLMPGLKSTLNKKQPDMNSPSPDAEGKFFSLWNWILPLLFGLTVGWFGMACLEVWLEEFNGRGRNFAIASDLTAYDQEPESDKMAAFLKANPFKVTPMPGPDPEEPKIDDTPLPVVGSLAAAILKGTSPGYLAWLEDEGILRLVMLGSSFDAYTLEKVTHIDATFVKDDEYVVKEITYGGGRQSASVPVRRPQENIAYLPPPQVIPPYQGNMGGNNDFAYEELSKLRMSSAIGGQGLRMDWIDPESVLARAGVEQNDVILVINEVGINSVMDMTNLLSTFEDKYQFTIEVVRNGEPTTVEYYIR